MSSAPITKPDPACMTRDYPSPPNEVKVIRCRYTWRLSLGMNDLGLNLLVVGAGIAAGGVASVAGFGIGSLLTPVFVTQVAAQVAVAAVSIPHVIGTAARLWLL